MHKYGFRDWDSVLAAIGHGGLKEGQVFNKLVEAYEKEHKKNLTDEQVLEAAAESHRKTAAHCQEQERHCGKRYRTMWQSVFPNVAVQFPGDEIVGFVTRGRGVTIHRTDCVNVLNMPEIEQETSH